MSGTSTWTPAPRGGLIPLQPLGFGTILGKSFAALRGNPKVLLGFAMVVQIVSTLVGLLLIGGVSYLAFSRLETVTDWADRAAITAGATLITVVTTVLVAIGLGVIGVIVQGVVIAEVSHAALGERATLGMIWRRVKPAFWRLLGYQLLILVAIALVVGIAIAAIVGLAVALDDSGPLAAVLLVLLAILAFVFVGAWLSTKLYVTSSAIVLEGAGVFRAIGRSWSLTRGRFWSTFGVMVLISLIMGTAASIVGTPFSLLTSLLVPTLAPTGEETTTALIAGIISVVLGQIVTFLIQSIAVVVQATSSALVYLDLRMRKEGIDLRMQRYVERRDAGDSMIEDPYTYDPHAVAPPRPPAPTYAPGGYGAVPGYAAPGYAAPGGYGAPGAYPAPGGYPPPQPAYGHPAPPYAPPAPPYGQPAPAYAPPPSGQQPYGQQPPVPQAGAPAPGYPAPPYGQQPQAPSPAPPAPATPPWGDGGAPHGGSASS